MIAIILAALMSLCVWSANAQTVADLWVAMPSGATPYLTLNQKKEMVECQRIGVDTSVVNLLQGTTSIDTLSLDYGRFSLSSSHDLQIVLLPVEDADTIVCTIDSYNAPSIQSCINFYDKQWKPLEEGKLMPVISPDSLLSRPDTMNMEKYEELCSLVYPELVMIDYNLPTNELVVSLSTPLTTKEEKEWLGAIISKRTLKWDGRRFNFCYK